MEKLADCKLNLSIFSCGVTETQKKHTQENERSVLNCKSFHHYNRSIDRKCLMISFSFSSTFSVSAFANAFYCYSLSASTNHIILLRWINHDYILLVSSFSCFFGRLVAVCISAYIKRNLGLAKWSCTIYLSVIIIYATACYSQMLSRCANCVSYVMSRTRRKW